MKHIKSINEFFDFLSKDDEEDKITLEFIKRLEKVKIGSNPYDIKLVKHQGYGHSDGTPDYFESSSIFDRIYTIIFDDVELASGCYGDDHSLYIDGERISCKDKYSKRIFNLINEIYQSDIKRKKLDKLKSNINPAADLL